MAEEKRYKISYRLNYDEEGMKKEDLLANNLGGTDAIIVVSILRPEDGSLNTAIASLDGNTNEEISGEEMFKAWVVMAKSLADSPTLGPGKRMFALQTFETIRDAVLRARGGG